jgi:hypothetical protein
MLSSVRWSFGLEKIVWVSSTSTSWLGLPMPARLKNAVRLLMQWRGRCRGAAAYLGDDHDGEPLTQLLDEVLDGQRRDRVQRGTRLIHEQHLWFDGNGALWMQMNEK